MGIQGLLPLLKDIQRRTSVSVFHGNAVGIDAYCWLHKGVYACAKDVVEGKKTTVYINYVMRRINMLLNYNIKPIMVFDGGYLPAKSSKEKERRTNREENLKKAKAFLRAGNNTQAFECFQRCVNISPAMATEVIQACREKGVLCIVAPYEADAQLAYLEMQGITQFTITEDSDLLIYGCKKVLFKMNSDGDGVLIDLAELNKVKTVALESFTMEKFRHMCILSGCDYLPSVKGLGLYKAHKFLRRSTTVYKAIQLIKQDRKLSVPRDYADNFRKTDAVFKYQSVFDPITKKIVRLNEVAETDNVTEEELQFAGPEMSEEKALRIALGNIDPISGETLADFEDFVQSNQPKQTTQAIQIFTEQSSKSRNPNLQYALDDELPDLANSEQKFEDEYMENEYDDSTEDTEIDDRKMTHFLTKKHDDLSPPEKSLRNIHLYEKKNPSPSLGILYDDYKRKEPTASRFGHRGVFVKRHKLKNPFRVEEAEEHVIKPSGRSKYFGSQEDEKENEISSMLEEESLKSQEISSQESVTEAEKQRNVFQKDTYKSPPPSKRAKFSFIQYLDSHSKNSLKRVASKLSDGDSPSSSPENEAVGQSQTETMISLETETVEPRGIEIVRSHRNETIESRERVCGGQEQIFSEAKSFENSGLPRLPSLPRSMGEDKSQNLEKGSNRQLLLSRFMFSKNPPKIGGDLKVGQGGRISLFKNQKKEEDGEQINQTETDRENTTSQESEISLSQIKRLGTESLHLSQMTVEEEDHDQTTTNNGEILHLQSRSFSEPALPRPSSSRPLLGKCRKIGLSKKSKSSLERIRLNDSKLTQSKIGFDKFAYTKKKIDWNDSANDDVICIS